MPGHDDGDPVLGRDRYRTVGRGHPPGGIQSPSALARAQALVSVRRLLGLGGEVRKRGEFLRGEFKIDSTHGVLDA